MGGQWVPADLALLISAKEQQMENVRVQLTVIKERKKQNVSRSVHDGSLQIHE